VSDAICELPVRVRFMLRESLPARVKLTVFCPDQRRSVGVETCVRCARNVDPRAVGERVVRCTPDCGKAATRAELEAAPIGQFMSEEIVCITPTMPIVRARERVAVRFGGHLPVVTEDGQLVGVVTERELRSYDPRRPNGDRAITVEDVMFKECDALLEDATVEEALRKMVSKRARLLSVVDESRGVMGVVSDVAILHAVATLPQVASPYTRES
jgi:CBS domain-containing protein